LGGAAPRGARGGERWRVELLLLWEERVGERERVGLVSRSEVLWVLVLVLVLLPPRPPPRRARSEGRDRVRCCGRGGVVGCRVCLFGCGRGGLSMGGGCRLRVDLCREAPLWVCLW
jgi:hypothetical protein